MGYAPLTLNARLTAAVQAYSKEMALRDHGGHVGADGSHVGDRIARAGYRWSAVAENVAYGQSTPEQVVSAWMHSEGHRRNLLNGQYQEIGIGYYFLRNDGGEVNYHHYWCRILPRPSKRLATVWTSPLVPNRTELTMTNISNHTRRKLMNPIHLLHQLHSLHFLIHWGLKGKKKRAQRQEAQKF
ncbi:MAG: CAP domain-containing protein [Caldilineaceae bacterium]